MHRHSLYPIRLAWAGDREPFTSRVIFVYGKTIGPSGQVSLVKAAHFGLDSLPRTSISLGGNVHLTCSSLHANDRLLTFFLLGEPVLVSP
jgi:hypothetical protein